MIKILIDKVKVQELKGVGRESGKPYELHIQTGYAYTIDGDGEVARIPDKFEFILPSNAEGVIAQPLPPGEYSISPASIFVDRKGRLSMNPRFVRLPAAGGAK